MLDTAPPGYPSHPPTVVQRPVMVQRWADVTYLHWPVPAAAIAALLPPGLEVDTFEGSAWVGLVPFVMRELTVPGLPALPWVSVFPETNVRTYARGPHGPGVWFCSLDAARLSGVLVALAAYGLPYRWARMRALQRGDELRFWSRRRWPGPRGARVLVGVRPSGRRITRLEPLDHWQVNRWGLYTVTRRGRLAFAPVEHGPWPLQHAQLTVLAGDLVEAAGLATPHGLPRVRYAPGVDVRVGLPRPI